MQTATMIIASLVCLTTVLPPAAARSQDVVETPSTAADLCTQTVEPDSIWALAQGISCKHIGALPTTEQVVEAYAKEPMQSAALYPMMQELLTAARLQEALALQTELMKEAASAQYVTAEWPKIHLEATAEQRLMALQRKLLGLIERLGKDYVHHFAFPSVLTAVGPWIEM